MPELPEVETIVRDLQASGLLNMRIEEACVFWPGSLAQIDVKTFCQKLRGQTIQQISRQGKYIVFTLTDYLLFVHLRMTGKLLLTDDGEIASKHERLQLKLSGKSVLHYLDQRKFGKWSLFRPGDKLPSIGIEPFSEEFSIAALHELSARTSMQAKPFLLNQSLIAGLGNIYVDEALWCSKIHPARRVNTLSLAELAALHAAILDVLTAGIANMGTSLGSYESNYFSLSRRRGLHQNQLHVFRQDGRPCPRCGTPIIKIRLAQRGTHLCPACQTL